MKRTGQKHNLPSGEARAMIARGSAEEATAPAARAETTALQPAAERAVTAAQNAPPRGPLTKALKRKR